MVIITKKKLDRGRGSDMFLMIFRYLPSATGEQVLHT